MTDRPQPLILSIDDDRVILSTIQLYLEDYDFKILTASNGKDGIEMFKTHHPQLLLLDLEMPEMNGLSVLAEIKKISPDTPVIVVTGTGEISDAVEALRLGAWDFIQKPINDMTVLYHSVKNGLTHGELIIENRRYQQELESLVKKRTSQLEQANSELQTINFRLRKIIETTKHITHFSRFEQFGSWLLEEFGRHMLASGGSLYLIEDKQLKQIHCLDPGHAPNYIPLPLPQNSILKKVLEEGKPVLIKDSQSLKEISASGWKGYEGDSSLIFPLPDESGKVQGFLSLHSRTPPPFIEQDRELGTILASYSSEAMRAARATEALKASEEYLSITLDSIGTAVIATDPEGLISRINPMAEELTGWSRHESMGVPLDEVFHLIDADTQKPVTNNIFSEILIPDPNLVWPQKLMLVSRNGKQYRIGYSGKPIRNKMGYSLGAVLVFRDITFHINLEEQLRQARKMEAIGHLAGGVAHDFNNMLAGIIGAADILANKLSGDQSLKKYISMIQDAGSRASELTHKLLDFSRKTNTQLKPFDLHHLAEEAIRILERSTEKRMEIKKQFNAPTAVIDGDAIQMENAILNLGINARDAMPNGGIFTIATEEMILDQEMSNMSPTNLKPGPYIKLSISDTGTGISQEVMDHVFEPFFTTKPPGKGTGLGLSNVYSTVQNHNGDIHVSSTIGQGTCFDIYLPLAQSSIIEKFHHQEENTPTGSGYILIVDDEDIIRNMAESMLTNLGYETLLAKDGEDAIKIYKEYNEQVRLVLMDIVMPKMNGRDAVEALQKINKNVRILLTSGFDYKKEGSLIDSNCIFGFIKKPYRSDQLGREVHRIINIENS